jgi:uncharacterized PurR-regulated membrane protein YhhQ (DUF165 family)
VFFPEIVVGRNLGFFLNGGLSLALCFFAAELTNLSYGAASVGRIVLIVSWSIFVFSVDVLFSLHYFEELSSPLLRIVLLVCALPLLVYWALRIKKLSLSQSQ